MTEAKHTPEAEILADAILKASGSALRHHAMAKSREDIFAAAQAGINAARADLLEALEFYAKHCPQNSLDGPEGIPTAFKARDAIAKAKGLTATILLALTLFTAHAHACVGQDSLRAHLEQVAVKLQAMAAKPDFNNAEEALRLFADRDATERAIAKGCGAETKTANR